MTRCLLLMLLFPTSMVARAEPTSPDLSGTWAMTYDVVTANKAPVVGSIRSKSTTSLLVHLQPAGDGWVQEHQVCDTRVDGGLVKTRVPEAYIAAAPRKSYPVKVSTTGEHLRYVADAGMFTTGYDPSCGPLPASPDDPCVIDWDSDGEPGATVHAKAPLFDWVQVYVSQRNHAVWSGEIVSDERFEGEVEMKVMSTYVLGASNKRFARSPESTFVSSGSRFVMQRIPTGGTCADVVALWSR